MRKVVITGSNRGIGLELARLFAKDSYVYGVCRQASPFLKEVVQEVVSGVDLTRAEDLDKIGLALKAQVIDILIHNAGVLEADHLGEIKKESMLMQFEVNSLAPLLLTQVLQQNLQNNSKVILVTSKMGSMADNSSGGYYGYRASKAALNAIGKSLAIDLKRKGIAVALLHPGFVQTQMTNHQGDITADLAAKNLKQRIEELSLATTGEFRHAMGHELLW